MPSVKALQSMSAKALDNLIHNATSIPVNGIGFTDASQAANHKYEPTANLDPLVTGLIADRGVAGAVQALGGNADAFRLVWDVLDDNYTYYNTGVNHGFVDLGIAYADYLKAGGAAIMDIVKYEVDNNGDGIPQRSQTMHDNILGNFDEASLVDKFGAGADSIFHQIQDAGYGAFLGTIGDYTDGRDYYGGYQGESAVAAHSFDHNFFGL